MSIKEISGKARENMQDYPGRRQPVPAELFQKSLMQNLKSQGQDGAVGMADKARKGVGETETEKGVCRGEERANIGAAGKAARIRINEAAGREAVQAAEVRHMSYDESDNIEIAVTEGYTLKGKLEGEQVYVEAKYEDGRLEAYYVDTGKIQEQTRHKIEQFAWETAHSAEE